jgi:hypothetical protein
MKSLPKIKISLPVVIKTAFVTLYVLVCAVLISPQIDYQSWYPEQLGQYDFPLGIEFLDHTKAVVNLEQNSLSETEATQVISSIFKRVKSIGTKDIVIRRTEDSITIHVPEEYTDIAATNLVSPGKIEIKKRPVSESDQTNAAAIFDQTTYVDSGLSTDNFQDLKIIKEESPYTYIAIRASSKDTKKSNELGEETKDSNIALFIDGNLNIAWIIPVTEENKNQYPILAIMDEGLNAKITISKLLNTPIQKEQITPVVSRSGPLLSKTFLYVCTGLAIAAMLAGLIYRLFIKKDSLTRISITAVMVIGFVLLVKLLPITITFTSLISIFSVILIFSTIDRNTYPLICAALFTISLAIRVLGNGPVLFVGDIFFLASLLFAGSYLITYLTRLDEEA